MRTWCPVKPGAHVARVAVLPGPSTAFVVLDHDGVAEVAEPQLCPVGDDEEVGGLYVAVADAVAAVKVLEGTEHLRRVRHGVLARKATCFLGKILLELTSTEESGEKLLAALSVVTLIDCFMLDFQG